MRIQKNKAKISNEEAKMTKNKQKESAKKRILVLNYEFASGVMR